MNKDKISIEHKNSGAITRLLIDDEQVYRYLDVEFGEWNVDSFESKVQNKSIYIQHTVSGNIKINGMELSPIQVQAIILFLNKQI